MKFKAHDPNVFGYPKAKSQSFRIAFGFPREVEIYIP